MPRDEWPLSLLFFCGVGPSRGGRHLGQRRAVLSRRATLVYLAAAQGQRPTNGPGRDGATARQGVWIRPGQGV